MQKYANLVELEKCCQTHIFLQKFVLIQPRTSPPKNCKIFQLGHPYEVQRSSPGDGTRHPVPEESGLPLAVPPDEVPALHAALEVAAAPLDAVRPVAENHRLAAYVSSNFVSNCWLIFGKL